MMSEEKMRKHLEQYGPIIARLFIATLFLLSGVGKIFGFEGSVGFAASVGMPFPEVAIVLAIILEIFGGLSLVFGYKILYGAKALFIYTLVANLFFHTNFSDQMEMIAFLKNLSIMGGLIYVMLYGAGPYSVGGRRSTAPADESMA